MSCYKKYHFVEGFGFKMNTFCDVQCMMVPFL